MNKIILTFAVLITIIASIMLVYANPILLSDVCNDLNSTDVFYPEGNHYDFRLFSMNVTNSSNFTVKEMKMGYVQLVSGKGYAINVLDYDKMLDWDSQKTRQSIENEKRWSSQEIDGVRVYTADFITDKRYGSFAEHDNLELYVTSDNPNETAQMVKTLKFN